MRRIMPIVRRVQVARQPRRLAVRAYVDRLADRAMVSRTDDLEHAVETLDPGMPQRLLVVHIRR